MSGQSYPPFQYLDPLISTLLLPLEVDDSVIHFFYFFVFFLLVVNWPFFFINKFSL